MKVEFPSVSIARYRPNPVQESNKPLFGVSEEIWRCRANYHPVPSPTRITPSKSGTSKIECKTRPIRTEIMHLPDLDRCKLLRHALCCSLGDGCALDNTTLSTSPSPENLGMGKYHVLRDVWRQQHCWFRQRARSSHDMYARKKLCQDSSSTNHQISLAGVTPLRKRRRWARRAMVSPSKGS